MDPEVEDPRIMHLKYFYWNLSFLCSDSKLPIASLFSFFPLLLSLFPQPVEKKLKM